MTTRTIASNKRMISILALMAVAAVGAVFAARPVGDWLLVRHYSQRLEVVEGREVRVLLGQAADLGEPGITVLVAGLGSSNESVARAAGEVIGRRMEDWKSLRRRHSSPLLGRLALELSDSAEQFDAAGRAEAARFAEEILTRRLDRYVVDRCEVILACQKVIRLAERTAELNHKLEPGTAYVDSQADSRTPPHATARAKSGITTVPIAQLAALPGGGLPKTTQPVLDAGRLDDQMDQLAKRFDPWESEEPVPAERAPGDEPRWFSVPSIARPLGGGRAAARLPDDHAASAGERPDAPAPDGWSSPGRPSPGQPSPGQPSPGRPSPRVSTDMSKTYQLGTRLSKIKTVDLLRCLNSVDPNGGDGPTPAAAHNELRLRGFTDLHFRVAEKLFDPVPAVRARLARELMSVPGLNPQPWLLVLARDGNRDVRLTAISLLATAADPAILAEVESLARRDTDHRIRRQAERMAQRRIQR